MSDKSITVSEQKEVEFYGDELTAVRATNGDIYVSVRHLCDALGLDRASQARRMRRDEILSEGYKGSVMVTSPGGRQRTGMIRVDLVPYWLARIDVSRVREEIKPKILKYHKNVVKVLWEAFREGQLTADSSFDELLQHASSDVVEAYYLAQAIVRLARNQIRIEAQLDDHETRLAQIEADLGQEERYITEAQASQISQAVKSVAVTMGKVTKRNEFGAVYGELYRKFNIAEYRHLPAGRFDEAIEWLDELHQIWIERGE